MHPFFFSGLVRPVFKHGPKSPTVGPVFVVDAEPASTLKAAAWTSAKASNFHLESGSRMSVSCPRLSLSLSLSLSPLSSLFSSSYTCNHAFRPRCVQHATPPTPSTCAAPTFLVRVPVPTISWPSRPLLFHSDIRGDDQGSVLTNLLRDSCQQRLVFSRVSPWLHHHFHLRFFHPFSITIIIIFPSFYENEFIKCSVTM